VPEPFKSEPTGGTGTRMHHKFTVIDFDKPTARVYLGSYNFSTPADRKNGENLVIVRDRRIAVSYMIEALSLFDHYSFRVAHKTAGPALLRGTHRSVCLYSRRERGTPQRPSIVLGLDRGVAALPGKTEQLKREHRLVGQRLSESKFLVAELAELPEANVEEARDSAFDEERDGERRGRDPARAHHEVLHLTRTQASDGRRDRRNAANPVGSAA